jgi:hypothetical protein
MRGSGRVCRSIPHAVVGKLFLPAKERLTLSSPFGWVQILRQFAASETSEWLSRLNPRKNRPLPVFPLAGEPERSC